MLLQGLSGHEAHAFSSLSICFKFLKCCENPCLLYISCNLIVVSCLSHFKGLPSHPQHDLAKKQAKGFGGMVSFRIKGDSKTAKAFFKHLKVRLLLKLHYP